MGNISENLKTVRGRIESASKRAGRDPSGIKLVAVSKTKPADDVIEAVAAGQRVFGENYAQELKDKYEQLGTRDARRETQDQIEWHFIGHLQKNKAKLVAPIVSWIETIDSLELAEAVDKRAGRPVNCLIEVNIGDEETKSGVAQGDVQKLVRGLRDFKNIVLRGLMIIPPYVPDPEFGRPYFKKLKLLLSELNAMKITPESMMELSMGMSHDFEVAIEEGATIIRVGTAIFGERT